MSRLAAIELSNYGPFRGDHRIELSPDIDVFAVTARHEQDETRSNWSGKSWLVHAIPLALFGEYPCELADGWISDGETEARVQLEFWEPGDGLARVTRSRIRGKTTQLRVILVSGSISSGLSSSEASGDHGQQEIEKALGLDKKDLFATSFVRQKQVNRLVSAKPAERLQIVSEWLGLDRLRRCREEAARQFTAARKAVEKHHIESPAPLLERFEKISGTGYKFEGDTTPEDIAAVLGDALDLRGSYEQALILCEEDLLAVQSIVAIAAVGFAARSGAERAAKEFDDHAERGRRAQADLKEQRPIGKEEVDAVRKARDEAAAVAIRAADDCRAAAKLARGEFDGVCPVTGGGCPIAGEIRSDLKSHAKRYADADAAARGAKREKDAVEAELQEVEARARRRSDIEGKLKTAAEAARALKPARDAFRAGGEGANPAWDGNELLGAARAHRDEILADLRRLDEWIVDWRAYGDRVIQVGGQAFKAKGELRVAVDQVEVFARAEREIGKAVLGEVEEMANRLLAKADVRLTVAMSWGRETKDLEPHCHRCGWQYPRGRGTKECAECGAPRMPKIEERLDLVASERSDGAAEDLAGLAVQLAAAAWLRAERGIRLDLVVLDEITASLDRAHRRAIGRVLREMIHEAGFATGFVISHSPDVVESLPGRIEIVVGADGSRRIEVR